MSKKLKMTFLIFVIVVILVICYGIIKVIVPDSAISLYGNRLEGIEKVPLTDEKFTKTNEVIKENEFINSAKSYSTGRIVNIIIDVKKDTGLISIETMLDKVLELYSDAEKAYYDFEVFVTCIEEKDLEDSAYPIIGSKHKTSLSFKWSNNS